MFVSSEVNLSLMMKFPGQITGWMTMLLCFCSIAEAQVLVHKEPKHHLVYENKQIRILDVVMAPGDSSIYHIHHTPSLFILFTNTTSGSMLQGELPSLGKNTAGELFYENLAEPNIRIHRVWNADTDTFHVMDIELLGKDSGYEHSPLVAPGLTLAIDTAWARTYRLTLKEDEVFQLNEKDRSFVLVSFSKASVETRVKGKAETKHLPEGGFIVITKGKAFSILNKGDQTVEFAMLENRNK